MAVTLHEVFGVLKKLFPASRQVLHILDVCRNDAPSFKQRFKASLQKTFKETTSYCKNGLEKAQILQPAQRLNPQKLAESHVFR